MQLSEGQNKVGIIVIILVVVGVGYFLWTRSVPAEPTIGPGQTIANPMGQAVTPVTRPGTAGGQGNLTVPGSAGNAIKVPAPGTVDPQLGMGPSANAPIPRQ